MKEARNTSNLTLASSTDVLLNSNRLPITIDKSTSKMNSLFASLLYIHLCLGFGEAFVGGPSPITTLQNDSRFATTALSAYSHSSTSGSTQNMHSTPWGSRGSSAGFPSRTACESAVNVEWEPMSELDRRIEDGIHYEHIPGHYESQRQYHKGSKMPGCHSKAKRIADTEEDDSEPVRAVFCAYRYSEEDYNRLKSAGVQ